MRTPFSVSLTLAVRKYSQNRIQDCVETAAQIFREDPVWSRNSADHWTARKTDYQAFAGHRDAIPGKVAGIQTFGELLNDRPHVHASRFTAVKSHEKAIVSFSESNMTTLFSR
jgi:hypothetical protein